MRRDSGCTEADPEQGWELSSTSLVALGWQIGCIFSQVIISGWVIYGPCDGTVSWPQVSQMSLRALVAVFTLCSFFHIFSHISSWMSGWCISLRNSASSHQLWPLGVLIQCMDLASLWVYIATFREHFVAVLKMSSEGPPLCPHLSLKRLLLSAQSYT